MRNKGALIILFMVLSIPFQAAGSDIQKRYALLIGLESYVFDTVGELPEAVKDTHDLAGDLIRYGEFDPDNVALLTSDAPLGELLPIKANIQYRLHWYKQNVTSDDIVFIYFYGQILTNATDTYFLTYQSDLRSQTLLESTAFSASEFMQLIHDIPSQQTVLIIDSFYAEPEVEFNTGKNNAISEDLINILINAAGNVTKRTSPVRVLLSSKPGEYSRRDRESNRSLFSSSLRLGIYGYACNQRGMVTADSLSSYVVSSVMRLTTEQFGTKRKQTPVTFLIGGVPDTEFLVASRCHGGDMLTSAPESQSTEVSELPSSQEKLETLETRVTPEQRSKSGKKVWYKKKWLWGVSAVVIGGAAVALAAGGSSEEDESPGSISVDWGP